MIQARRFLFDTCFDQPEAEEPVQAAPPAAPAPPPLGEADLEAARAAGFAAGRAAGAEEERGRTERLTAEALARIAGRLDAVERQLAEAAAGAQRRALAAGLAVARALAPALLRRHGIAEIEALLRECLQDLIDEPRLVLRLPDAALDPINARIATLTARAGFAGRIILLAEDGMADGDCRIEWADGGVERSAARLLREVEAVADRFLPAQASGAPSPSIPDPAA